MAESQADPVLGGLPSQAPPPCILARLPIDLQVQLVSHLSVADLSAWRHVSREWAYHPLVTTRLFGRIDIRPHALILKHFVDTFSNSPVREVIRELCFVMEKWWTRPAATEILKWPGFGQREIDFGWPALDLGEDLTALKEEGQKVLLPLLLDVFDLVSPSIRVSSRVAGRYWREEFEPEKTVCREYEIGQDHEVRKRMWLRYATSGTLFYALSLSRLALKELQIVKIRDNDIVRLEQWYTDGVYMDIARDRSDSIPVVEDGGTDSDNIAAFTTLKGLRLSFGHDIQHSCRVDDGLRSVRLKLLQRAPNLESLDLCLEKFAKCPWKLYNGQFDGMGSSLEPCCSPSPQNGVGLNTIPLFPKLRKLCLRRAKCRPGELMYFLQFHCPSLRTLLLESIVFMYEPPKLPYCWVKFLKELKRECANIKSLDICGSLCNFSGSFNGFPQHWHISQHPLERADHPWLKDQVLEWYHDQNVGDEACPLNDWELDYNTRCSRLDRQAAIAMKYNTDGNLLPFRMDKSWEYMLCVEPDNYGPYICGYGRSFPEDFEMRLVGYG